jgi:DNA-directed RNA polymerase I, II, and III subunit RPABC5
MIIPIRCMNCGFVLADKWRYYESRVAVLRGEMGLGNQPIVIDGTTAPETPERKACDEVGITRYCCRKTMLTHRDLITKI